MRYEYDPKADALYIYLSDKEYAYGEDLDRERRIDYDQDGNPIGVELLCVSNGVSLENLPHRQEVEKTLKELHIKVFA